MVAVVNAGIETRKSLAKTAPTTLDGLVAYIDYVRSWSLDDFLFDGSRESRDFLESLHRAVHNISGLRPIPPLAVTDTPADSDLIALEIKIMAVAHEAEISGPAYNLVEDAILEWRKRDNPMPIWPKQIKNKKVKKIVHQIVDHIEQGGNLESFKLVAPVITKETRAMLGEVVKAIKLQNEWDRREKAAKADFGYDETKAKWEADCMILDNLTEEIAGTPAMTKEGIKIKRRIARYRTELIDLDGDEGEITKSIKRDIRMQRKLAAA